MSPRLNKLFLLSLILISTISCGAPKSQYDKTVLRTRESVLKEDLLAMRKMIDQYAADQGRLPQSLDDLVKGEYLHQIPEDPITEKPDWKLVMGEDPNAKGKFGIVDIRSSSTEKSIEGKPYNEW